jgi:hypothetical protein
MTRLSDVFTMLAAHVGSWIHGTSGIHARRHGNMRRWAPKARHLIWTSAACLESEGQAVLVPRWRLLASERD